MRRILALLLLTSAPAWAEAIDCTESALHTKIAALNSACSGDKEITFDVANCATNNCECSGTQTNIVIRTDANGGSKSARRITCSGVTIDGESNIHFTTGVSSCASTAEGGEWLFRVAADDFTAQNFAYSFFGEGIHLGFSRSDSSDDSTVTNVQCDTPCDDCFTNDHGSDGNVLQNSTFSHCSDKCLTLNGPKAGSYPTYDIQVLSNTFTAAAKPFSTAGDGRILFKDNTITDTEGGDYDCDGPVISRSSPGANIAVYLEDNVMTGCKQGVAAYGGFVRSTGNQWIGNIVRGFGCAGQANCLIQGDIFDGNGGGNSGTTDPASQYYIGPGAGFGLSGSAVAHLGGGGSVVADGNTWTPEGGNQFLGNEAPGGAALDVANARSAYLIFATSNWWGEDADPSSKTSGDVAVTPWLDAPPTGVVVPPSPYCGDNNTDPGETCDGTDLGVCTGGVSAPTCDCTSNEVNGTYDGGTLTCATTCTRYIRSACTTTPTENLCGNDALDTGEDCDPGSAGVEIIFDTCSSISVAFKRGTATCTAACTLDKSDCSTSPVEGSATNGGANQ